MHRGPSTSDEDHNFSLRSDRSAVEGRIERYVKTIQNKYNEVQKMFSPDNFFTGALYSNNVLTLDQLTDIQLLQKQPGGKAKALIIVLEALNRIGDRAADPFLRALLDPDSRQDALALLIDPERAQQLIRERDNS